MSAFDGFEPKSTYYQTEGATGSTSVDFTPKTISGDFYYEGTFTMPAANTVIGGEFEKKTYTASVNFGSAHAGFVQQYYAGKDGIEVDGSVVKLTVAHEEKTPQNVALTLYSLLGSSTSFVDNNEFLMTNNNELLLGKKTRAEYQNEEDYTTSRQDYYYYTPITQNMTLYALWAPPVGDFTLTLTSCKCGDILEFKDLSQVRWEPEPYQRVEGHVSIFNDTNARYSGWDIQKPENSNIFTLQGGTSNNAYVYIAPNWGYFLPDDFADSMTVVNGTYVNSEGGTSYRKLNVSIPVKHVAPEGTEELAPTCTVGDPRTFTCSGCNKEVTETADALGHDWGDATYTWTDDNSACTATHTCKRDSSHVQTETVKTSSTVTKEPTATETGTRTYTATFKNEAFNTQTKAETIPKEEDGVTYSIVEGANATWTKGATTSVTITAKRSVDDDTTFSHFTGILVDEKEVDEDQYDAEPGSVVVTLPASFLNTLSVGEHTFTALFDDGSVSTKLNVKSASQAAQTTNTSVQSPAARSTTTSTTGGTTTSTTSGTTTTPSTADKSDTAIAATLAVLSLPLLLVARRLRRM